METRHTSETEAYFSSNFYHLIDEDEESVRLGLDYLRASISSDHTLTSCRQDANFLLRFLRVKKYNSAEALCLLRNYLSVRRSLPAYFRRLDPHTDAVADLMARGYMFPLPARDLCQRRVIVSRGAAIVPGRHAPEHVVRANLVTFETLLREESSQVHGFTYVFDQQGTRLSHLLMWNPSLVSCIVRACEKSMPMRHCQINFINNSLLIDGVLMFVKQLLSRKLQSRFLLLSSIEDLHKTVPANILPKEYGGQMSMQEMIDKWREELEEARGELLDLDAIS